MLKGAASQEIISQYTIEHGGKFLFLQPLEIWTILEKMAIKSNLEQDVIDAMKKLFMNYVLKYPATIDSFDMGFNVGAFELQVDAMDDAQKSLLKCYLNPTPAAHPLEIFERFEMLKNIISHWKNPSIAEFLRDFQEAKRFRAWQEQEAKKRELEPPVVTAPAAALAPAFARHKDKKPRKEEPKQAAETPENAPDESGEKEAVATPENKTSSWSCAIS